GYGTLSMAVPLNPPVLVFFVTHKKVLRHTVIYRKVAGDYLSRCSGSPPGGVTMARMISVDHYTSSALCQQRRACVYCLVANPRSCFCSDAPNAPSSRNGERRRLRDTSLRGSYR